jgi:hypothetical protein
MSIKVTVKREVVMEMDNYNVERLERCLRFVLQNNSVANHASREAEVLRTAAREFLHYLEEGIEP